ncbi:hypothetical protein [uncultured Roseobacter sp.]|uniref:hypothetical protein n=1 Tax=uncultured Roseobacter sp. TaxID=114847 RepID=UPI002633410D|nr:hypothetical protein [uncultured Roseobacter sp.]
MQQNFKTAKDVSEHLLELTGGALMAGDFELFLTCFQLPYRLETFEGNRVLNTSEDLRVVFDAVRAHYNKCGVTQMFRHCVEARFRDPATIAATHETRLISGTVITQEPFAVYSILEHTGEKWVITSSSYAIGDREDHNSALLGAGTSAD